MDTLDCGLTATGIRVNAGPALDLSVACAECVSLSGPSGAGKTLLLRALVDLDPHVGRVALNGVACADMRPAQWRRRVGMLPADSPWWFERVGQHFVAPIREQSEDTGPDDYLAALGFEPGVLDWSVARLSSGERQRLALARLLSLGPQALLLDEPSANLDPDNGARVEQVIATYRRRHQAPVLWVSHDPAQRLRVARRHLIISPTGLKQEVT